jgi:hypothetical protein
MADWEAGASLQLPQDFAVGEHAAQFMSSSVLRMCEFSAQRLVSLQSRCQSIFGA